jgi:hypothetical protein
MTKTRKRKAARRPNKQMTTAAVARRQARRVWLTRASGQGVRLRHQGRTVQKLEPLVELVLPSGVRVKVDRESLPRPVPTKAQREHAEKVGTRVLRGKVGL